MQMTVGIDQISFYTPPFYLSMATLAHARGIDPNKLHIGLGQQAMSVLPPDESIVTMAAYAAEPLLTDTHKSAIDTVLFATESGVDQSKAAGIFVHHLLGLNPKCRVLELKQACYSATAALQMGAALIRQKPERQVLVIASDVARYGLGSAGEPSQGCGAVALRLSANPKILALEPETGLYTEDVMDFWRPNYRDEALVEGRYSCEIYLKALIESWTHYTEESGRTWQDHAHFLYHTPFPKLAEKADRTLRQHLDLAETPPNPTLGLSLTYSRQMGNCYTGSLYLCLAALLDQQAQDLSGQRIGFYSYGSGCVAEWFSGTVQPHYKTVLLTEHHQNLLNNRQALSINMYEQFYRAHSLKPENSDTPHVTTGRYRFAGLSDHKPQYENRGHKISTALLSARAPGKLILSGEHAVVQGAPALVVAINRYTTATLSPNQQKGLSFHLPDIEHLGTETFQKLRQLKHRLQDAHQKFRRGERGIQDIVQKPFELLQYTATNALDKFSAHDTQQGFHIHTESTLPIGCGLGSSAASIVSTNYAIAHYLGKTVDDKAQYELSLMAENLQHGYSSGIDLHTAIQGGCHLFQTGKSQAVTLKNPVFQVVNTGKPAADTGACVAHTRHYFQQYPEQIEAFSNVTQNIQTALTRHDEVALKQEIRTNHQLLVDAGVVPERVQNLIRDLEAQDCAGKICGAGSISGDHAGIVWLVGDVEILQRALAAHTLTLETLHMDSNGVTLL